MDEKLDTIIGMLTDDRQSATEVAERLEAHMIEELERSDSIAGTQQDVLRALNGSNKGPGAFERIRVLEKFTESAKTWGNWLKIGVAGLLLKFVWDVVIHAKELVQ